MEDTRASRMPDEIPTKETLAAVRIGACVFDAHTLLLSRGGADLPLRAKSAEVLAVLTAHPDSLVTKPALMDAVWPDTHVTEDSLVQCVADIRRALGPDAERLRTYPKRGYRLESGSGFDVEQAPHRSRRLPFPGALPLAVAAALLLIVSLGAAKFMPRDVPFDGRVAILVRPFQSVTPDEEAGLLAKALHDGVVASLARFPELAVIAPGSSARIAETGQDPKEIGDSFGVDYVLDGTQDVAGNDLWLTVRLIDTSDGSHVWADTIERETGAFFALQSDVVRRVAGSVGYRVGYLAEPEDGATHVAAFQHHLRARNVFQRSFDAQANAEFRRWNERAIAADPGASWGWSGLAWHYRLAAQYGWNGLEREEALRLALENAEKGLTLAPDDYYANFVMAGIHETAGDIDRAIWFFDRAIALNPSASNALVMSAAPLLYEGNVDEALARLDDAVEIDPLHPPWFNWNYAWALWRKGECDAAHERMRRIPKVSPPAHGVLAVILACLDREDEAREALAVYVDQRPDFSLASERARMEPLWTDPGWLDRWIDTLRRLGAPE